VAERTPQPAIGWNNSDVAVTFTGTDDRSGMRVPSRTVVISTSGGEQVARTVLTDQAGNETEATLGGINVDRVGPSVGVRLLGAGPNGSGWYSVDVLYEVIAEDLLSGVDDSKFPENPFPVTGEGAAVTGQIRVYDRAGNSTVVAPPAVKIDRTPPVMTLHAVQPALAEGQTWHRGITIVQWACQDALSGAASTGPVSTFLGHQSLGLGAAQYFSIDGANLTATGWCNDAAGNTTTATHTGINIDMLGPTVVNLQRTPWVPAPNYVNTDIVLTWDCVDHYPGSPIVDPHPSMTVTEEGSRMVQVECRDGSGLVGTGLRAYINIDKTPPTITRVAVTQPDLRNGWYSGDVTGSWTCADTLSGIVAPAVTATLTTDGPGQMLVGTCTDRAGNTATDALLVNVDRTPPTVEELIAQLDALITVKQLDRSLNAVVKALARDRSAAACRRLDALIENVDATNEMKAIAGQLLEAVGCFSSTPELDALIAELDQLFTLKKLDNGLNRILKSLNRHETERACSQVDRLVAAIEKVPVKKLAANDRLTLLDKVGQLRTLLGCHTGE
jgi:hypothetical protein